MKMCGICGLKKGRYVRYRGFDEVLRMCFHCFELVTRLNANDVFQGHLDKKVATP